MSEHYKLCENEGCARQADFCAKPLVSTGQKYHEICNREGRPHSNCSVCAEVEAAIAHADFKKLPPAQLDHLRQKAKHTNFGVQLPDGMTMPKNILIVKSAPASDETVEKFKEAWNEQMKTHPWNEQLKTHPPLAEHSTCGNTPMKEKLWEARELILTRVFKFLCYLNTQDHTIAEQREHVFVTRELKALLEKTK